MAVAKARVLINDLSQAEAAAGVRVTQPLVSNANTVLQWAPELADAVLAAKQTWALDFTLTFCTLYLPPGAAISSTTGGVTQAGTYAYQSDIGQVSMTISPGSCRLSLS